MRTVIRNLITYFLVKIISASINLEDYESTRNNLLEEENGQALGGKLQLDDEEAILNKILMQFKEAEVDESFKNPDRFNFSKHYFTYRDEISNSKVYQIIKRMPKGGALHIHSTLMLGADYFVNLTYEDHLYTCYTDHIFELQFSDAIPQRHCPVKWTLFSELRRTSIDVKAFDAEIIQHFTLHTEEKDINTIWDRFEKACYAMQSLILYRPVQEKFFYESLKRFYNDNVMYIELRSSLHSLYELDGSQHERMYTMKLYQKITDKFKEDYPDFIGIKFIITKHRRSNIEQIGQALDFARHIKREVPEMFAGFDLVGQEDKGKPLVNFLPALLEAKEEMNFYFHSGETNWFGMKTDENLIDAILLGSKRIGHGYALTKHPTLMKIVKNNDIAVEVNVISNAVLSLVRDVRNHPLAIYLALDLPIVLSSDGPGVWGAEPSSHDFYISFVGVASKHADLRTLKQLALNSIKYSALDNDAKEGFFNVFNKRWSEFVKNEITLHSQDKKREENKGKPLVDFLPALIEAKEETNFYFHAGETNWFGMATDENLIDAVLLATKRIGHGYALAKHPALMAIVYKNDIAVEVNVISNAVLSLVRDVRNHPLAVFLALDLPVVLSSDDPGAWGAEPLSHDFYISFVGVASKHADLRTIKQFALNSIKYSALDNNEKERFYNGFNKQWSEFVRNDITLNS